MRCDAELTLGLDLPKSQRRTARTARSSATMSRAPPRRSPSTRRPPLSVLVSTSEVVNDPLSALEPLLSLALPLVSPACTRLSVPSVPPLALVSPPAMPRRSLSGTSTPNRPALARPRRAGALGKGRSSTLRLRVALSQPASATSARRLSRLSMLCDVFRKQGERVARPLVVLGEDPQQGRSLEDEGKKFDPHHDEKMSVRAVLRPRSRDTVSRGEGDISPSAAASGGAGGSRERAERERRGRRRAECAGCVPGKR